jgi:hypothetical protein
MPTLLAALAAVLALAGPVQALPQDPFQRCAVKALRGDYGRLHPWQAKGYRRGLSQGATASRVVWLTAYYASEGRDGRIDNHGNPCTYRTAAANEVPRGSYIWTRYGLRQVLDSGAHRNDGIARRKGAEFWVDYWAENAAHCPFGDDNAGNVKAAVIR